MSVTSIARSALLLLPAAWLHAGPVSPTSPFPEPSPAHAEWWINVTSYAWITAQTGDLRIAGLPLPVDVSFSDAIQAIDEIDMAFMGGFEAGRGRTSLGVDVTYARISDDFVGGGNLFKSFGLEQAQWMINPFLSHQLAKGSNWHLDAMAGARINIFEMDVTGRFERGGQVTVGGSREWTDPVVGLRGACDLTDRLTVGFRGDIGGFGISSDLTWQAYVGIGWRMTRNTTVSLGYRGLGTDYGHGSFGSDVVTHGPVLGLQTRF